jgi:hypothetical protein
MSVNQQSFDKANNRFCFFYLKPLSTGEMYIFFLLFLNCVFNKIQTTNGQLWTPFLILSDKLNCQVSTILINPRSFHAETQKRSENDSVI